MNAQSAATGPPDHDAGPEAVLGPWNPGIVSELPPEFLGLTTILSEAHSLRPLAELRELAKISGLTLHELADLRPERLILHELLIRVMTELTVPDGETTDDLGFTFRAMTSQILRHHVERELSGLVADYRRTRSEMQALIEAEIADAFDRSRPPVAEPSPARPPWWRWFGTPARAPTAAATAEHTEDAMRRVLSAWGQQAADRSDPMPRACFKALSRAGAKLAGQHGTVRGLEPLLGAVATSLAVNSYASERLGQLLEPIFLAAARREGYRLLPSQSRPVIMNTKGASASGKSSLRSLQREFAARMHFDWRDFALISPDIWRKQLLDYDGLGAARRYAGTLTAHEVEMIDRKLDRYVSDRAARGRRTHMLIDRFRFDSFAPEGADDSDTQLLTRFGSEVYMFFLITPPHATIERAWYRGERVGRYKSVDDLLAHNVEAYAGMPGLFFRWAASRDKTVYYEFVDNSVALGERPRTIAFGKNGAMTVLDASGLIDIERFKRVDIEARSAAQIFPDVALLAPGRNSAFLQECIRRLPDVVLAAQATGKVYAVFKDRRLEYWNEAVMTEAIPDRELGAVVRAIAEASGDPARATDAGLAVVASSGRTLGVWGMSVEAARPRLADRGQPD